MNKFLVFILDMFGLIMETPIQKDLHIGHHKFHCNRMLGLEIEATKEHYTREVKKLMSKKYDKTYIGTKQEWESTLPKFRLWNEDV